MQKGYTLSERSESKGFAPILLILIGFLVMASIGGAYYFGKSQSVKPPTQSPVVSYQTPKPTFIPQATSTPVPIVDKTANWKLYTNNKYKFIVKYPPDWKYEDIPNSTYPGTWDGVWFLPQSANLPFPNTDQAPPISLSLSLKPSEPVDPKFLEEGYQIKPYQSGILQGEHVTGTSVAGFEINNIYIKAGNFYINASVGDKQYFVILDQILSTFKFTE